MPRQSFCRHFHAPIRWVKTPLGHSLALDESSDPDGTLQIVGGAAVYLSQEEALLKRSKGFLLFQPHAFSCTQGKQRVGMPEHEKQRIQQRRDERHRRLLNEMTNTTKQ